MQVFAGGSRVQGAPGEAPQAGCDRPAVLTRPPAAERALRPLSELPGICALLPNCPHCGESMVWRGVWSCDACAREVSWTDYAVGDERDMWGRRCRVPAARFFLDEPDGALLGELARGVDIFSSPLAHKSASSPSDSEKRAEQREWLGLVEGVTSPFRRKRASRHRLLAAKRAPTPASDPRPVRGEALRAYLAGVDPEGDPLAMVDKLEDEVMAERPWRLSTFEWHEQRRKAQAERFARIHACGTVTHALETFCPDTGEVHEARPFKFTCKVWRLCPHCLKRRQNKLKRGVEQVRPRALKERKRQCSKHYKGRDGRWSERLLTVTVPHSGDAAADAAILRKAIPEFTRRMAEHLKKDRGATEKVVYVRGLEVAPSDDGGHAHAHFWLLSPFLEHSFLRVTWGRVLEAMGVKCPQKSWNEVFHRPPSSNPRQDARKWTGAIDSRARYWCRTRRGPHGRQEAEVSWPIVDVRGARGAAEYAAKVGVATYVVKGAKIQRMHPLHAGAIYVALEGARAVVWARGWAPQPVPEAVFYRLRQLTEEEKSKWVSSVEPTESLFAARTVAAPSPPFPTPANDVATTPSQTPPSHGPTRPQQTRLPFEGSSGSCES